MTQPFTFHEIITLEDALYDDYLDLYQQSFPLDEQVLVSDHNRALRQRMRRESSDQHLLAMLDEDGALVGMARYELETDCGAAVLWYVAVQEESRGKGAGTILYREIVRRVAEEMPDVSALVYEVEKPDHTPDDERARLAERRIAFYQRNGAVLLGGIHYVQSVGWQPEVQMHLMLHPYKPIGEAQAFAIAKSIFGDALEQVGELSLKPASQGPG